MDKKKTKIICTIGPSSDNKETLKQMVLAGMNVARLNFSHGTYESQQHNIDIIREIRKELNVPLPILLDTKGPEYRIGEFKEGKIYLNEGDPFVFYCNDYEGDKTGVSVSYKNLFKDIKPGDSILVNDGLVNFRVDEILGEEIHCTTVIGGKLSNKKSMSFPGKVLKQVFLSQQDKNDLLFGIKNNVDFVACSFVSNAENIKDIRTFLDDNGGEDIQIIAKIENRSGVDNAESILDECEGLMVARGDLGVEIPYAELPAIQKHLIKLCHLKGGICITATEMLESMTEKPRPTRAEISDVANAVFDGSSAVMLSGETASGKYPVKAVEAMTSIALDAEKHIDYIKRFGVSSLEIDNLTDALSHAAGQLSIDTNAKCLVTSTISGFTARMVSRCRVPAPIIGITCREQTYRQMDLYWNVTPLLVPQYHGIEELINEARNVVKEQGYASKGDIVVLTGGLRNKEGGTKLIHADVIK